MRAKHLAQNHEIERRLRPRLPKSLPPEDEEQVKIILNKKGIVSKFAREQVSESDIWRLKPYTWLNDEIINFYGAMILARSEKATSGRESKAKAKFLNVHYFSTFFWPKLRMEGYEHGRLSKWTKGVRLRFSKRFFIVQADPHDSLIFSRRMPS
jgi:sentrin-specific protease 1